MKTKLYEKIWHNISFDQLNKKLSLFKKPDQEFYNEFYKKFFIKFKNYNDIDNLWKIKKKEVAEILNKKIEKNSSVLSYGCGIGYVESILEDRRKDIVLDCFDFSNLIEEWFKNNNKNINFISSKNSFRNYDYIYMVELLYAYEDKEIYEFLLEIKNLLNNNGEIIIINNIDETINNKSFFIKKLKKNLIIKKILNVIRPFYYFLLRKKNIQFWGFQRSKSLYDKLFKSSGFRNTDTSIYKDLLVQTYKKIL
tara:strand:+ start:807 stop:1562 length:756 start_codon:yes stop_codon:yes gene_type:complete